MTSIQRHLHGHVVVAGYGTSGAEAVDELIRRGATRTRSSSSTIGPRRWKRAETRGVTVLEGDATRQRHA